MNHQITLQIKKQLKVSFEKSASIFTNYENHIKDRFVAKKLKS